MIKTQELLSKAERADLQLSADRLDVTMRTPETVVQEGIACVRTALERGFNEPPQETIRTRLDFLVDDVRNLAIYRGYSTDGVETLAEGLLLSSRLRLVCYAFCPHVWFAQDVLDSLAVGDRQAVSAYMQLLPPPDTPVHRVHPWVLRTGRALATVLAPNSPDAAAYCADLPDGKTFYQGTKRMLCGAVAQDAAAVNQGAEMALRVYKHTEHAHIFRSHICLIAHGLVNAARYRMPEFTLATENRLYNHELDALLRATHPEDLLHRRFKIRQYSEVLYQALLRGDGSLDVAGFQEELTGKRPARPPHLPPLPQPADSSAVHVVNGVRFSDRRPLESEVVCWLAGQGEFWCGHAAPPGRPGPAWLRVRRAKGWLDLWRVEWPA